jgi:outer membrane biosynthesis protein TonB
VLGYGILIAMILLEQRLERLRPRIGRWRRRIEAFDLDRHTVLRAFALSVAIHLFAFGTWRLGGHYGLWQQRAPRWLERILNAPVNRLLQAAKKQSPPLNREIPLMFVEVDPRVATQRAPKTAKYYSAQNSVAANPDTRVHSAQPKLQGHQTQVVRTFDRAKPTPTPLQPAPAPKPTRPAPQPSAVKPKASPPPGNLTPAKPQPKPHAPEEASHSPTEDVAASRSRPLTLAEARSRLGGLAGQRMRQDGGVRHYGRVESENVLATPFGAYDRAIIEAVQQHWYDLLDQHGYASERAGKVVLEFHLNEDGSITEMQAAESTVGYWYTLLCEKAVLDPAPFAPWPADLKRLVGGPYRAVRFTFFYN